jgi:hypothetical protein
MLCGHFSRVVTMWICDQCFQSWHWDVLCHLYKRCQLINDFALGAPSRPRFLGLDNITNFTISSHGDSYLVENLKDCN